MHGSNTPLSCLPDQIQRFAAIEPRTISVARSAMAMALRVEM
jgi:hypothetical protein